MKKQHYEAMRRRRKLGLFRATRRFMLRLVGWADTGDALDAKKKIAKAKGN